MKFENVGEVFKHYRKEAGYTLAQMGDLTGVSHAYLSNVENNKSKPSEKFIDEFLKVIKQHTQYDVSTVIGLYAGINKYVTMDSHPFNYYLNEGYIWKEANSFEFLNRPYLNVNFMLSQKDNTLKYYQVIDHVFNNDIKMYYELDEKYKKYIDKYIETLLPLIDFDGLANGSDIEDNDE